MIDKTFVTDSIPRKFTPNMDQSLEWNISWSRAEMFLIL